jgi:hypothetical protein
VFDILLESNSLNINKIDISLGESGTPGFPPGLQYSEKFLLKKHTVILLTLLLGLIGLVAFVGYMSRSRSTITLTTPRPPQANLAYLSVLKSDQVLALVGVKEIRGTDIRAALQMDFHGQAVHGSLSPTELAQKISNTLDRVVEDELLSQLASQEGLTATAGMPLPRQDLANQLVEREVSRLPQISDHDLRAFYKDHGEKFYIPPGVTVRELFLPVSTLGTDRKEELDRAQQQGKSLAERLRRSESAEALALEFVPEAFRDRAKGYVFKGGTINENDERSILNLKPGEVIGPIRVEGGVSVFQGVSRERPRMIPFYQAQDKMKFYLESNRIKEIRQTLIEKASKQITVQRFVPGEPPSPTSKS